MAGCQLLLCMLTYTLLSVAYLCFAAIISQMGAVRKAD